MFIMLRVLIRNSKSQRYLLYSRNSTLNRALLTPISENLLTELPKTSYSLPFNQFSRNSSKVSHKLSKKFKNYQNRFLDQFKKSFEEKNYSNSLYSKLKKKFVSFQPYLIYLATTLSIWLLIDTYIVSFAVVEGHSMQPTLNPSDSSQKDVVLVAINPFYSYKKIQKGDIIIFRSKINPTMMNIKRVVGLEGDSVTTIGPRPRKVSVPRGHCWVEGDNVHHSFDSNKVGPIPLGLLYGKAFCIIYPFSRIRFLQKVDLNSRVGEDEEIIPNLQLPVSYRDF